MCSSCWACKLIEGLQMIARGFELRFPSRYRSALLLCEQWSTLPTAHHQSTRRSVDCLELYLGPSGIYDRVWRHAFLAYKAPGPMCSTLPRRCYIALCAHEARSRVAVSRLIVSLRRSSVFQSNVQSVRHTNDLCFFQSVTEFQAEEISLACQ